MRADEDFWDDILGHLKQGVLVPVVGPELVQSAVAGGAQKTLSRYIGERLAERYALSVEWTEQSGLDDAVRAYVAANGRDKAERLYRVVNDILADARWPAPESLKCLARISDFNLFVSTTFDSLLARAIDEVRFDGERTTRELWFATNQSTAVRERTTQAPRPHEAVVFKLFGEASSTQQYALNDEDVLEWLHALLTETTSMPEWLGPRLKQHPLLFIGCQFSDWIGRFLIRLVSEGRLSTASKQFFLVGTDIGRHRSLAEFLQIYCGSTRVQIVEADSSEFTAELLRRWTDRNPPVEASTGVATASVASPGSIFISYVREDAAEARRLADAITQIGGDVWLDARRLQAGDRWQDEILNSIRRDVRLFVPLISKHTEEREEGYVFKEWREAVERAKGIPTRRFIVPVVIDEAYEGNPAAYRQVPSDFMALHFGRAPAGHPNGDLLTALTEEIRAMRRRDAA